MPSKERRSYNRTEKPPVEIEPVEIRRARAKCASGDSPSALKTIDSFLEANPLDSAALFVRSRILYEMGDRPASLAAKLKALKLKRASTDAAHIAEMLMEDDLFDEAEMVLRARLDDDDDQHLTRFTLCRLLLESDKYLEAGEEIERLAKRSKATAIRRVDYLIALRLALLGDSKNLEELVARLVGDGVTESRLEFFEAISEFINGGDPDRFAAILGKIRSEPRLSRFYQSFYKSMSVDKFLGVENRSRGEFRKVLGTRLKLPKIKGAEFTSAEKVIVDSLFGRYLSVRFHEIDDQDAGMSGDRVLRAHTELSRKGEKENSCLLKIGAKYRLAVEREKMAAYVQNRLHPRYHPQVLGFASGRTDAGMRLSWASGDDEELFSLRRIFTDAEYSCERLEYEINRLMTDVLKGWYIDNVHMRQIEIYKLLKKYADKLVGVTLADGTVLDRTVPELEFPEINRCIRNPILVMDELVKSRGKESVKVPVGLHHGDLNSRNVLLDSGGHICLIDFYKSGRGVIFQDAARLEVDLRYEALNTMEKFHRSEYLIELTWMDSFLVASSFKNIEKVDVRRSMEKRLRSALQLRKVMSSMYNMPEKVFAPIYKCSLLSALIRLLGYGYLKDELVKLALVEISDLSERLLAEG